MGKARHGGALRRSGSSSGLVGLGGLGGGAWAEGPRHPAQEQLPPTSSASGKEAIGIGVIKHACMCVEADHFLKVEGGSERNIYICNICDVRKRALCRCIFYESNKKKSANLTARAAHVRQSFQFKKSQGL